jgi:hypothetical protein
MKAAEALIAWTPAFLTDHRTRGQVRIGPRLGEGHADWTRSYAMTGGAKEVSRRKIR